MGNSPEDIQPQSVTRSPFGSAPRRLQQAEGSEALPRGAVLLTVDEVYGLLTKTINNWQPQRDVWPLKYGALALGGVASIGGAIFIIHFRQRMLLGNHARIASFIPTVFLPGLVTSVAQHSFVMQRLLNAGGERPMCPVCAEMRAVTIQVLCGVVQPFLLAVMASSALAKITSTYPLPPFSDWRAMLRMYVTLSRPLRSTALILVAANVVNSAAIAFSQGKAAVRVHAKLTESDVFLS
jgi:hypothetical protein